jgi:hypothetical protein
MQANALWFDMHVALCEILFLLLYSGVVNNRGILMGSGEGMIWRISCSFLVVGSSRYIS